MVDRVKSNYIANLESTISSQKKIFNFLIPTIGVVTAPIRKGIQTLFLPIIPIIYVACKNPDSVFGTKSVNEYRAFRSDDPIHIKKVERLKAFQARYPDVNLKCQFGDNPMAQQILGATLPDKIVIVAPDEIPLDALDFVLEHEYGHVKGNDVRNRAVVQVGSSISFGVITSIALAVGVIVGVRTKKWRPILVTVICMISAICISGIALDFAELTYSRYIESRADRYAFEQLGAEKAFAGVRCIEDHHINVLNRSFKEDVKEHNLTETEIQNLRNKMSEVNIESINGLMQTNVHPTPAERRRQIERLSAV